MSDLGIVLGAIVSLEETSPGQYKAVQQKQNSGIPSRIVKPRLKISWSHGIAMVEGFLDVSSFEIGVNITIAGVSIGNIYGNLKDGVNVDVELSVAKGKIGFYLKNGNEFWVRLDIKVSFDGSFGGDYKIITF